MGEDIITDITEIKAKITAIRGKLPYIYRTGFSYDIFHTLLKREHIKKALEYLDKAEEHIECIDKER